MLAPRGVSAFIQKYRFSWNEAIGLLCALFACMLQLGRKPQVYPIGRNCSSECLLRADAQVWLFMTSVVGRRERRVGGRFREGPDR